MVRYAILFACLFLRASRMPVISENIKLFHRQKMGFKGQFTFRVRAKYF